jgi:hypothetical protein
MPVKVMSHDPSVENFEDQVCVAVRVAGGAGFETQVSVYVIHEVDAKPCPVRQSVAVTAWVRPTPLTPQVVQRPLPS